MRMLLLPQLQLPRRRKKGGPGVAAAVDGRGGEGAGGSEGVPQAEGVRGGGRLHKFLLKLFFAIHTAPWPPKPPPPRGGSLPTCPGVRPRRREPLLLPQQRVVRTNVFVGFFANPVFFLRQLRPSPSCLPTSCQTPMRAWDRGCSTRCGDGCGGPRARRCWRAEISFLASSLFLFPPAGLSSKVPAEQGSVPDIEGLTGVARKEAIMKKVYGVDLYDL